MARIIQISSYYANIASTHMLRYYDPRNVPSLTSTLHAFGKMQHYFGVAFNRLETPLFQSEIQGNFRYTVRPGEARLFLQSLLEPPRPAAPKPFPFKRLPAELRSTIYEMVTALPRSGVWIADMDSDLDYRTRHTPLVFTRDYNAGIQLHGQSNFDDYRSANPFGHYLNMLLANKHIYREAMLVFYKQNKFVFPNLPTMSVTLSCLAAERRNHIENVYFLGRPTTPAMAKQSFELLLSMPFLKRLEVHVPPSSDRKQDFVDFAGMSTLSRLRGLESVSFSGNCNEIKDELKSLITQPKLDCVAEASLTASGSRTVGASPRAPLETENSPTGTTQAKLPAGTGFVEHATEKSRTHRDRQTEATSQVRVTGLKKSQGKRKAPLDSSEDGEDIGKTKIQRVTRARSARVAQEAEEIKTTDQRKTRARTARKKESRTKLPMH